MKSTVLVVGALLACMTSGASFSSPTSAFAVSVQVRHYPVIYRFVYSITPTEVVITHTESEAELQQVFHHRLTKRQSHSFGSVLEHLPLQELKRVYDDPNIQDGFVIRFSMGLDGKSPKTIDIANSRQRDLAELCSEINKLVPRKFAIRDLEDR